MGTWTSPEHTNKWNFASDDWQCPKAENDLKPGGKFLSGMEVKNGSMGFEFSGTSDKIIPNKLIAYILDDGRKVKITFKEEKDKTKIAEIFEGEDIHSVEKQTSGWQSILNNFKKYAESIN